MAPNPRIGKAFRAMKDLGISEAKVKPVLKSLLKLYNKNWVLIEEENYRALADAIFEKEEEAAESEKPENIEGQVLREEVLEEEAVHEEPERPLKRLRLRHQEGQASPSADNSSSVSVGTSLKRPKVVEEAELPGTNSQGHSQGPLLNNGSASAESQSPCLTNVRNKGKEPVSPKAPQIMSREKNLVFGGSSHASNLNEPKTGPGNELSQKQKLLGTHALIKPKDEPCTLNMPQFEIPIAVIHPEPSNIQGSSSANATRKRPEAFKTLGAESRGGRDADEDIPTSSNGIATSHELVKAQNGHDFNLDIASSISGEVKVFIDCDSALGRSDFHLPSLEAVLKLVEDKCLKSYKILDPSFSVRKLLKDLCDCFLEQGTQYYHELKENTNGDAVKDVDCRSMVLISSNGCKSLDLDTEEAQSEKPQLPLPNGHNNGTQTDQTAPEGNCDGAPEIDQNILEPVMSQTPVALCGSINSELGAEEAQLEEAELARPCNGHNNCIPTDPTTPVGNCDGAPEIDQNILEPVMSQSPVALCGSINSELGAEEAQLEEAEPARPCNGHNNCIPTDPTTPVGNCDSALAIDQNILEHVTSQSPVDMCESTLDETGSSLVRDITKGQEKVMITVVNEVNTKSPPSFHYIAHNAVFQNAYLNFSLARIGDDNSCSTCSGDCLSLSTPCACAYETGGDFAYTKEGLVKEELLKESISMNRDPKKHCQFFCKECPLERSKNEDIIEPCKGHLVRNFIKECWWKCGCNMQCGNRVVQRGISRKLQVFMTPGGKGWGLRTLEDLPRGAFICEYVGEVLTNAELFDRVSRSPNGEEHSYPVLLDADWGSERVLKDEEALCLDATFYGNVARFINHRCYDSNMVEIPVEIETPDHHYYHLAFFTTRKVKAMEELTWDYGIDFDDLEHPVKAFKCQCGSKFCRSIKRPRRTRARKGW